MRLFSAVPLSTEAIERLIRIRLRLCAPGDGLRWSTPEQWHITLQFYGDVDEERAACLADGLAHASFASAPEVILDGLGRFAAKGILHATVGVTPGLLDLQQRVVKCGSSFGFVPEARPFRPHVTLARSKGQKGVKSLRPLATPDLPAFGPDICWMAREILLLRSTLCPQGAEYAVVSRIRLPDRIAVSKRVN